MSDAIVRSDTKCIELFGDWWTEEMSSPGYCSSEYYARWIAIANTELKARGFDVMVLHVAPEQEGGDELLWTFAA